MVENTEFLVRF